MARTLRSFVYLAMPFSALALAGLFLGCGAREEPSTVASNPAPVTASMEVGADYASDVDAWHADRVERLKQPTGWLSLVGLFWLEEGDNTFGSAETNDLVFPEKAPAQGGTLRLEEGVVTLTAAPGIPLIHGGETITVLELASDATEEATEIVLGSFQFYVLDREGRVGIRLKDREALVLATFEGIERFPVDPAWRIEARWESYDPPKKVLTPNVLGSVFEEECPGAVVFSTNGTQVRLEPTSAGDGQLFLVFADGTSGDATYGGGRFLYLDAPEDGKVIIDFNRSYNPPCVFTPYATCPLPRRENRAGLDILAGEKVWGGHHDV